MSFDWRAEYQKQHGALPTLAAFPQSDGTQGYDMAVRNALSIAKFWQAHGYLDVRVSPARQSSRDGTINVWGVESNLRQGLPPGVSPDEVAHLYRSRFRPAWERRA
jgi:hypothetical protein